MSKVGGIKELLKAVGRAFRGPVPQPQPAPPITRPAPPAPRPAPIRPQPPRPEPPTPKPRHPVPSPETGTNPQTEPEPQAEPDPETDGKTEADKARKTEDEPECQKCPQCAAREMGASVPNPFGPVSPKSKRGYDYQHFVCPWHYYMPESNTIEEWKFSGVDFDGLHPVECHLFEAKHGYEGFLEQRDWSPDGRPQLQKWAEVSAREVFEKMFKQARRQYLAVIPHYPEVRLTWVFSSAITSIYVFEVFLKRNWVPPIDAEVRPFIQGNNDE